MQKRHKIQFPPTDISDLDQSQVFFYLLQDGEKRRIGLHDYDVIYGIPGLYEQIVYERLRCQSPEKVVDNLKTATLQAQENFTELRVLDFGAGNGKVGDALKKYGVSRLVGADNIEAARVATERDRPGLYDAYYVKDFCNLDEGDREELGSWSFNCLTIVAALGFGDIPPSAFIEAMRLIQDDGWVAINIKETFFDNRDKTGFSKMIRELIFSEYLDLYDLERYRHRLSFEGEPLYYFSLIAKKCGDVPVDFLETVGVTA